MSELNEGIRIKSWQEWRQGISNAKKRIGNFLNPPTETSNEPTVRTGERTPSTAGINKHIPSRDQSGARYDNSDNSNKNKPVVVKKEISKTQIKSKFYRKRDFDLAKKAIKMAKEFKLECKILERKDCEKEGMGAYLAVAKGSDLDPKFIHLIYKPSGQVLRRIALVGKGLTFDSGGYNLKVGASKIEMMKYDMGGSASVLGAARSIGEIAPKGTEIHFIIASCENMVNGSAVHPGDIIQASNGKTIEINNTDAEGRLTLADALTYACKLKPDVIIDLATLTGACVVALGEQIAGLWANNDELAEELKEASSSCGENLWRMPLQATYKEGLKSMLADIKNTGPRAGGSITAALFLREFVEKDIAWAHIDIAGPCWSDKGFGSNPAGATGYGVQTLVNWACNKNN